MTCDRCGSDDIVMDRLLTEPSYEWTVFCRSCGAVWHPANEQLEETRELA